MQLYDFMKEYYIQFSYGEQDGPLNFEDVKKLISAGDVNESDKIWQDEKSEWIPVAEFQEFKELLIKSKEVLSREQLSSAKKEILLVDDDANILGLLKDIFSHNYDVRCASNGVDALKLIHRKKPALAILDVMLPKLSGFEILKRLKSSNDTKNIPVIMLTAKGSGEDKLLGISLEADEYIPKPFEVSELERKVEKWLK